MFRRSSAPSAAVLALALVAAVPTPGAAVGPVVADRVPAGTATALPAPLAPAAVGPSGVLAGTRKPPAVEYASDRVLVKLARAADASDRRRILGSSAGSASAVSGSWVSVETQGRPVAQVVRDLAGDPAVERVERDVVIHAHRRPDDPLYRRGVVTDEGTRVRQYAALRAVRMEQAWDLTRGSRSVVVAVLDTGVRATHRDLRGKLVAGRDIVNGDDDPADDHGHGTAVAGIVAANTDNGAVMAGVGWKTRTMPVKVLDRNGNGTEGDLARGIRWAADNGADVVNMSVGGYAAADALRDAVRYASRRGVVLVASAGNDGGWFDSFPASLPGVISVAATDAAARVTHFSNVNYRVDIAAPGFDMVSLSGFRDDYYAYGLDGTSFSAPIVSGVAALMRAHFPSASRARIGARMMATARDAGPRGFDPSYGAGVLDAAAALGAPLGRALAAPVDREGAGVPADARRAPIGRERITTGAIAPENDVDWWSLDVPSGEMINVALAVGERPRGSALGFDPVLELFDSRLQRIGISDVQGIGKAERITRPAARGPGRYLVRISNFQGSRGERPTPCAGG